MTHLRATATALYISYDGLLEPLGQSQVLPYVEGLADSGIAFTILSFEKPTDLARRADVGRLRERLGVRGIRWVPLRYHKRPSVPATAWDIICGSSVAIWLVCRQRVSILHARGYVAGLMCLAARAASGARLAFDMRGFWPEERIDGGLWRAGSAVFRLAKRAERMLLRAADAVIVLTEPAKSVVTGGTYGAALSPRARVTVVPCCVELDRFAAPNVWEAVPPPDEPRSLVYAGSIGTWYMLDEMLEFYRVARARDPEFRFVFLNRDQHDVIAKAVAASGVDGITVIAAAPEEVPRHFRRAWAGLYFIKPVFSKIGSSPTKLGEYLAAGLPVIVNAGVGDTDELVRSTRVGVVIDDFSPDEYRKKWDTLVALVSDPELRGRCRETARLKLALDIGVARYRNVYESLLAGRGR